MVFIQYYSLVCSGLHRFWEAIFQSRKVKFLWNAWMKVTNCSVRCCLSILQKVSPFIISLKQVSIPLAFSFLVRHQSRFSLHKHLACLYFLTDSFPSGTMTAHILIKKFFLFSGYVGIFFTNSRLWPNNCKSGTWVWCWFFTNVNMTACYKMVTMHIILAMHLHVAAGSLQVSATLWPIYCMYFWHICLTTAHKHTHEKHICHPSKMTLIFIPARLRLACQFDAENKYCRLWYI